MDGNHGDGRPRGKRAEYIPSPAEIAAGCRQIQEGWSEVERAKRAAWTSAPRPWTPPAYSARHAGQEVEIRPAAAPELGE